VAEQKPRLETGEEDYGAVGQLRCRGRHCDGLVGKLLIFVWELCVEFNSELSLQPQHPAVRSSYIKISV